MYYSIRFNRRVEKTRHLTLSPCLNEAIRTLSVLTEVRKHSMIMYFLPLVVVLVVVVVGVGGAHVFPFMSSQPEGKQIGEWFMNRTDYLLAGQIIY